MKTTIPIGTIDVPMKLKFWFRIKRTKLPVPAHEVEGQILVEIKVGKTHIGPKGTGIHCKRIHWHPGANCHIQSTAYSEEVQQQNMALMEIKTLLSKAKDYVRFSNPPVTAAKVWEVYQLMQANAGGVPEDKTLTTPFLTRWQECIVELEKKRRAGFMAEGTIKNYRKHYNRFLAYATQATLTQASPSEITDVVLYGFRSWLIDQRKSNGQPYDQDYISKCCIYVKVILNYCKDHKYCQETGTEHVKLSWKRIGKAHFASEKDLELIRSLREEAKGVSKLYYNVLTAWLFAQETCLHWIDYHGLRTDHFFDLDSQSPYIIKARQKTGIDQTVFLSPLAKQIIAECGGVDKLPKISYSSEAAYVKVSRVLKEIREHYGIKNLSFSLGRKTYLTRMHNERKASPLVIMETAGWVSYECAKHYIHPNKELLRQQQLGSQE